MLASDTDTSLSWIPFARHYRIESRMPASQVDSAPPAKVREISTRPARGLYFEGCSFDQIERQVPSCIREVPTQWSYAAVITLDNAPVSPFTERESSDWLMFSASKARDSVL